MTCKLSLATLDQAKATAAVPSYSRTDLSSGIVHFGVGNFHRAHQAIYLDDRRVPAEYDPEGGRLTWRPRARIAAGRHSLRIEAVDRLGNRATSSVPLEVD